MGSDEIAFQNSSNMMDSENRASSPRFQSSKTILRSLNADFGQQYADDNVYEYVEMSKKTKIPDQDVKKKPIYDQDYKYPKYVIFCSKNSAEVDKKSRSPPNKTQQISSEKSDNLPIVQQQKFDESILNSQFLIENRRLIENSSEIISKFKNLIDYEQNYGHAYEDLYAPEHSYEYVESNRSTRFHVQKIDEPKSKLSDDESKIQLWAKNYAQHCRATCIGKNGKVLPRFYEKEHGGSSLYDVVGISDADEHVYEALDTSRPSRFKITKVDESALRSQIYEPICVRPRWVDYLYIPPPHKRLPKKDCMGRVQWLNKPVRKKTSAGSISGRGLSTSNSRKMSDNNIDSSNTTSRKNSDNFDTHIYENTEIKTKPACEEVVSKKDPLETRLETSEENNTENITERHSEVLSKPKPLIEQERNKQTTDDLEANSNLENTDVEGMRTYEAVFL